MDYLATIFVPTGNRRLNELIGFLLCVSALLLFLALASYSPLDPSFNSASVLTGSHAARNWIGIVGAYVSDACCRSSASEHFCSCFPAMLGARWFRSRKVQSPWQRALGAIWLLMFVPALLALLPGHVRWMGVIPIEGLVGRIVGDFLIHYLNLAGAYIVCATILAVALYLSTAFSFSAIAGLGSDALRVRDCACGTATKIGRTSAQASSMQKELEKRRAAKPVVTDATDSRASELRRYSTRSLRRTGIETMLAGTQ